MATTKKGNPDARPDYFGDLSSEVRSYVDLKVDEIKLKATQGLSMSMSRLVSMLLVVAVLIIVLGLLTAVLIQWLGVLTGSIAVSSTIVLGIFVVVLAVLFHFRKDMFKNTFVKLFIDVFFGDDKEQ